MKQSRQRKGGRKAIKYILPALIAVALIGSVLAATGGRANTGNNTAQSLTFSNLVASGSAVKGNPAAKVTLIEFGDFQCDFCHRYANATYPQIDQQYVGTGLINVVFKHFAWYGQDSVNAAEASLCANEQGKFWQYHDVLYQNQKAINSGWASKDNLKGFASQVQGLDTSKFNSCFDSGKYSSQVNADISLAKSLGFQGTPQFIVEHSDGTKQTLIPGAYPASTFQQVIDKALSS
ncbi:MAG TPA: thioredoxin domain-containing protein [Nitrososphaera sp.]|nr:thioredoxin domain-containing protein [Nitrososphaera sp.]